MAAFVRPPSHRRFGGGSRSNPLRSGGADGRKSFHAINIPRTYAGSEERLNATQPSRAVQRVSGWFYDGQRFREGTVGWEEDVVVEIRSGRTRRPLAEGLIIPGLWNAHTHLGDAIVTQELKGTIEELVAPPHGLKHRVLAKAKDAAVIAAMRRAMATMIRTGTTGFSDFREGGLNGLKLLYAALAAMPMQGLALGRPVGLSYDPREVAAILRASARSLTCLALTLTSWPPRCRTPSPRAARFCGHWRAMPWPDRMNRCLPSVTTKIVTSEGLPVFRP